MTPDNQRTSISISLPPWMIIGAVAVLVPLFAYSTLDTIRRQKENSTRLLKEMGAALIRSFEAGTRTGMRGGMHPDFKLQRLLTETARQPDIVYLAVTDIQGRIVAHSDLERIGTRIERPPEPAAALGQDKIAWREVPGPDDRLIFEVYRRFVPTGPSRRAPMGMMRGANRLHLPVEREDLPPQMIYVGLDMTEVNAASAADVRHAVLMGSILLLVGFSGIVLLFVVQGYRASRLSLSRERAFSDTLVENMPTGLIALDAERRIATVNPAARAILQLSEKELAGTAAVGRIPRELIDELDVIEPSGTRLEKEIDCLLSDGRRIPIALSGGTLKDGQNDTRGYMLLFKDLSEVHRLRREIARNQRLAAVGRLAAGVAHEIRNPLSSIKGFATYFRERTPAESEAQQIADVMIQEVDRLNRVITQLLEFARPVSLSPKTLPAHPLIASSIRLVDREAERRGIRIETRLSPRVTTIRVDPDRLHQVLLNLYLNALEAMQSGGRLTVALEPGERTRWYRIRVSDTGCGIDEEHLAHVFDPYFTTKPSGTGLGLAIVHNIVEALAGQIAISSGPQGGTIVVLNLPGLAPALPDAV